MEIGTRLKNARTKIGLTQERVAEEIGVSRQSVSNWENNRSYPDIVSVIKLSDLYSVSLDELLKEDKKMIDHLNESTNVVESRRKFSLLIELGVYLLIWAAAVLFFHVVTGITTEYPFQAKGIIVTYVAGVLYLALPIISFIISLLLGLGRGGWTKWLFTGVFGLMEALALFVTIGMDYLSNKETFAIVMGQLLIMAFVAVTIASAVGMGIGTLIRRIKTRAREAN